MVNYLLNENSHNSWIDKKYTHTHTHTHTHAHTHTTETTLNAKINEVKGEIPINTNLATNTGLNDVENEIPSISNIVKKNDYNTNINEIEKKITDHNYDKYITTSEFDKLISENSAARLKQVKLATKSDIANFVNNTDFDGKLKNLNKKIMHFQICTC